MRIMNEGHMYVCGVAASQLATSHSAAHATFGWLPPVRGRTCQHIGSKALQLGPVLQLLQLPEGGHLPHRRHMEGGQRGGRSCCGRSRA